MLDEKVQVDLYPKFPPELKALDIWVVVAMEPNKQGNLTKVPYNANLNGTRMARSNDMTTAAPYLTALRVLKEHPERFRGIGFFFPTGSDFVGADFDDCINEDGSTDAWAAQLLCPDGAAPSVYVEKSWRGKGFHAIGLGSLNRDRGRRQPLIGQPQAKAGIELYEKTRLFCVSGNQLEGTPSSARCDMQPLIDRSMAFANAEREKQQAAKGQEQSNGRKQQKNEHHTKDKAWREWSADDSWYEWYMAQQGYTNPAWKRLSDDAILFKAKNAVNYEKFRRLWDGKWATEGDWTGYGSQSEADEALCTLLAFWTGENIDTIDRLFRLSGLCRDKWTEREDYRAMTLMGAIITNEGDVYVGAESEETKATDDGDETSTKSRYAKVTLTNLFSRATRRYLIKGYLNEHEVSMLLAFAKIGKTFNALDMAIAIATGSSWMGLPTKQGKVLIVAAEGVDAFKLRLSAALRAKGLRLEDLHDNIEFVEVAVPLLNEDEVRTFIDVKKAEMAEAGQEGWSLIILDTLARCTAGENENDNGMMTKAIDAADRIRRALNAMHLMTVHHMSHQSFSEGVKHRFKSADEMKARGASAFGGAVDTVLGLFANARDDTTKDTLTLGVVFRKEGDDTIETHMRRKVGPTGFCDEDGEEILSCYMEPAPDPDLRTDEDGRTYTVPLRTQNGRDCLAVLHTISDEDGVSREEWFQAYKKRFKKSESTFNRALTELKNSKQVCTTGEYPKFRYYPLPATTKEPA